MPPDIVSESPRAWNHPFTTYRHDVPHAGPSPPHVTLESGRTMRDCEPSDHTPTGPGVGGGGAGAGVNAV